MLNNRTLAVLLALGLLLPALSAQAVPREDILGLQDQVNRMRMFNNVHFWLQHFGDPDPYDGDYTGTCCVASDNAWDVVSALRDSLVGYGWDAGLEEFSFEHPDFGTVTSWNVIARKDGWHADGMIVMGCHWDTVDEKLPNGIPGDGDDDETPYTSFDDPNNPAPGADDNGSGTAAVLEMARILGRCSFRQDVEICFFGAEEIGIKGSEFRVQQLDAAGINVAGYFNVDMIGFDADAFDFKLFYDPQSNWFKNVVTGYLDDYTSMPYVIEQVGSSWSNSDLLHFWQNSKPAVGFWEGSDHAPFWNQSLDVTDNSISGTGTFLLEMTRTILAVFCEWADVRVTTAAEDPPLADSALNAWPNPFHAGQGVTLRFAPADPSMSRELTVFDIQGRRLRSLTANDSGQAHWDGRDTTGAPLAAGVYLV
ncbi:M20/M25/M40 family metallo-hydrolase, partial [bacterium]|nr:M20/M25/M40 family metallo-hydrolase [bacterium]